jgi:hypothetical protein
VPTRYWGVSNVDRGAGFASSALGYDPMRGSSRGGGDRSIRRYRVNVLCTLTERWKYRIQSTAATNAFCGEHAKPLSGVVGPFRRSRREWGVQTEYKSVDSRSRAGSPTSRPSPRDLLLHVTRRRSLLSTAWTETLALIEEGTPGPLMA